MASHDVRSTDAVLNEWQQGDISNLTVMSWSSDTSAPLTAHSQMDSEDDASPKAQIFVEFEASVVITQTCDLVRSCVDRPFVHLAPVVRLGEDLAREASREHRPRYVAVPALGPDAFADLDIVTTVEKSLLAASTRTQGCRDDHDRRRFSRGIARKFGRFAFPDDLSATLAKMTDRIRRKHDKSSPEGLALAALAEIRVNGSPSWDGDEISVFLIFSPSTRAEADEVMTQELWDELVDQWLELCVPQGVIDSVDGAMIPLDELLAIEYVDSDRLDLDHLSVA